MVRVDCQGHGFAIEDGMSETHQFFAVVLGKICDGAD
jgi:hypothetical protein